MNLPVRMFMKPPLYGEKSGCREKFSKNLFCRVAEDGCVEFPKKIDMPTN